MSADRPEAGTAPVSNPPPDPVGRFVNTGGFGTIADPARVEPIERARLWAGLEVVACGCTDPCCNGGHTRDLTAALGLVDQPVWSTPDGNGARRRVRLR